MYGYDKLIKDIARLKNKKVEILNLGITGGGKVMPCVHIGKKRGKQIVIVSGIHAREHITCQLAVRQAEYYLSQKLAGGLYIIPMANPDGVDLCVNGLESVKSFWDREYLKLINNGSADFTLWKANLYGVDLNVNFDARYGTGKSNTRQAGPANYIGQCAFSEIETKALADFILKVKPASVLCFHCKGEEIYWKFHQQNNLLRDKILADILAKHTGYKLVEEEGSAGGLKDWCIEKLGIPAFTVEVGSDEYEHPYPYNDFDNIYQKNKDLPKILLDNLI